MPRRLTPTGEGRVCAAALLTGLLVAGGILVGFARRLYFFGDDWNYLLNRGTSAIGLFAPHNEHWSTLPILLFRGLFATFGLDHYLPYALPVIVTHLVLSALVYLVLVRLGCSRAPALAAAFVLAFFGGGAENTLWDFQFGFIVPLVFAWFAIWSWHRWPASILGTAVSATFLVLGLMSSGIGIAMVVMVVGFAALTTGFRSAIVLGAIPTAVYLVWYVRIGNVEPTLPVTDRWDYFQMPGYVWTGLTSALEQVAGIEGSGPVLLLVLVAAPFVVRDATPGVRALAIAGVFTAFVQFLLQASTRISLGIEQAASARYAYLTLALFAPAIAILFGWLGRRLAAPRWVAGLLVAGVAALYVVNGIDRQHEFVEFRQSASSDLPRLLRGIQAVTRDGEPAMNNLPFPAYHGYISPAALSTPEVRAAFSQAPVSRRTELDAHALVNVGIAPASFGLARTSELVAGPELTAGDQSEDGCVDYTSSGGGAAFALLSPAEGAELSVTGPATSVTTQLDRDDLVSLSSSRAVTPGEQVFVGVRVPGATLRVLFDQPGTYTVCSATPPAAP